MLDISLYDLYVNGMLNDLHYAQHPDPNNPPKTTLKEAQDALERFQKNIEAKIAAGGKLKNFYTFSSEVVTAYHTQSQVDTPYPNCGGNNPTLTDTAREVSAGLAAAGRALNAVPVYGQVLSLLSTAASIAVKVFGATRQSNASCVDGIILVPSCLQENDLDVQVWVGQNQNPLANPKIDFPKDDNWWGYKHVDPPQLIPEPVTLKVPTTDPRYDAHTRDCDFKILRVRLRNWNNCENLQLYFEASWDAPMTDECKSCADFGMMSKLYRGGWLFNILSEDKGRLTRYFMDQVENASKFKADAALNAKAP